MPPGNTNNNFDILSNNNLLNMNGNANNQQQQNQSPGAFLDHQGEHLNNNRNNEMSQINRNDQSVCSNLLNDNQPKGSK